MLTPTDFDIPLQDQFQLTVLEKQLDGLEPTEENHAQLKQLILELTKQNMFYRRFVSRNAGRLA